ncbi:alanine/glycine:cation symporter family protein [Pectinatus sottacetonis]|uniref:alanine/glycine:cation symporter family protein n=1 Tax=Pectinatus sottacetonis TaxID=1002795 RepID=UPI0018C7F0D1|nr:alanine/glycine:cation symporter family protein [Pectinatus sottacetonis]
MDILNNLVSQINGILWSYILIILLIGAGLIFTIRTNFVQIRYFTEMFRLITDSVGTKTEGHSISSFQAFCVSTASRVGVGNIAGIAIAIVTGGPGAIFWMWIIALLGAATGFIESTLAQIYKVPRQDGKGGFLGGPAYYIRNALHAPHTAIFFAILISITYGLIFNSVQANTISLSLQTAFGFDKTITGIVIGLISALMVFGGMSRIAKITEYMVPIMAGIYILVALGICIYNFAKLPLIFTIIFKSAWGMDQVIGGGLGAAIMTGIKRGLFSNEAGMGSVPNAAATADAEHPAKQGLIQAFGVFVDTLFICSASAFIILITGDYSTVGLTGVQLVQHDLSLYFGNAALSAMAIIVFLFAFTSIIGNYYYGEINIKHLSDNPVYLNLFRILVILMVFFGSIAKLSLVWNLADLFMAFMAITNIIAILRLSKQACITLNDYTKQKKAGIKTPVFDASILPKQDGIVWWKNNK